MPPSSLTLQYGAELSATLFNYRRTLEDNISKTNAFMHYLMKKVDGGYKKITDIGDRVQVPLMYELGQADSYSGYDNLDTSPMDGITAGFWDWRQMSVPIAISGAERKKNKGRAKIVNLLESKTKQAELGIHEFFNHRLLVGAGSSTITTPYTSARNGSVFIDPLPKLVAADPTASVSVGNINGATESWWRNQFLDSAASTFKGFLKDLRVLRLRCGRGPGGKPDLHLCDEGTYILFETALAEYHRNTSYQKADIPFDNILFYGSPVTQDERMPDWKNGTETLTKGSWLMLNMKFFEIQVEAETDFVPTSFKEPEDQDAMVAHILWMGGVGMSNRRKHGVYFDIDTTIAS